MTKFIGKVISGDGVGRGLGFPTANLDMSFADIPVEEGVYAAYAIVRGTRYAAALAVHEANDKVEVHVLDYNGDDLYGEEMSVEAVALVSAMESFASTEELTQKIAGDVEKVRTVLRHRT